MKEALQQLVRHLRESLGVTIALTRWTGARRLPPFLQDRYLFYRARLLDTPCLFLVDRSEQEEPPATIRRHVDQVRARWDDPVVYVRQRVTAYNRKRLIEQRVPFVVPGNQVYLPTLGIDLREHFRRLQTDRPGFRPATQAVLIQMLLSRDLDEFGPGELVPGLGYSAMTISRALDELENAGLAESRAVERERRVRLKAPRPELWHRAQSYLRDPVKQRHWVRFKSQKKQPELRAGLTALAHYSTLAEPYNPVLAVGRDDWRLHHQRHASLEAAEDEAGAVHVEVWSYPPKLFATDGLVDRLSLYLSLRHTDDERIEAALEEMMEDAPW